MGSGSLLVGAAYYGAYVMGADLDYKLVNAIGKTIANKIKHRFSMKFEIFRFIE